MVTILKHNKMFEGQMHFMGKMQAHLHHSWFKWPDFSNSKRCGDNRMGRAGVPEDVKEGHFAVLAANTEKPQRFVVELQFLDNPAFLSLLKRAEEEYGFEQKGVLAVPCRPEELEKILQCKVEEYEERYPPTTNYHPHKLWR